MANKVEIIVVAKDETSVTFKAVEAKAKESGSRAGKGFDEGMTKGMASTKQKIESLGLAPIASLIGAQQRLAKASDDAGKAVEKFGENSNQAVNANLNLSRAAIAVEGAVKKAQKAFSGMTPELEKSLQMAGLAEHQIKGLGETLDKGFTGVVKNVVKDGEQAGAGFFKGLFSSFSEGGGESSSLVSVLAPVLIGAMGIIGPLAGAALTAGVIGAAGTGGLIGGIMLAAQDPAILAAFGDLGTFITKTLTVKAEVFKAPLMQVIPELKGAFSGISGDIGQIFSKASTWVKPLADAIEKTVTSISGGLKDMVNNGDGVMSALFDGIQQVGGALGDMFTTMSKDGPAAATALNAVFDVVVGTINAVSFSLDKLTKGFGFLSKIGALGPGLATVFDVYNQQAQNADTITQSVGKAFDGTKTEIEATRESLQRLSDDLKAQTDPMFALMKAQEDLTKKENAFNTAVREHGVNSLQARDASVALGESVVDLSGKSAAAAGTFNGKLSPAMIAMMKAAGVPQAAIDALGRSAETAQGKLTAMAHTYTVTVATIFTQTGKPSTYTSLPSNLAKGMRTGGAVGAAASGGVQGNMTLVGEDGPELLMLPYGSSVKTASQTQRMMKQAQSDTKQSERTGGDWHSQEILYELRQLNKNMAKGAPVYLDNRLVGAVQGRQASLYERAG